MLTFAYSVLKVKMMSKLAILRVVGFPQKALWDEAEPAVFFTYYPSGALVGEVEKAKWKVLAALGNKKKKQVLLYNPLDIQTKSDSS